jgi:threonine/homoserine/homoserine lactone efflux protein
MEGVFIGMEWGSWVGFLGASAALTLMPGPDILFVISQSVSSSRRMGAAVAFGLCTGLLGHISAAALGISVVVYGIPYAFQAVKIMGALYLFYLAWLSWKSIRPNPVSEIKLKPEAGETSFLRLYRRGILMNILNPKVSLFFLAFLPQFVSADMCSVALQMNTLCGVFLLQALIIFNLIALLANRIGQKLLRGAQARRWTGWFQTILYAVLGLQLLFING